MVSRLGTWFRRVCIGFIAGIGIVVLSGIAFAGWMFYKSVVPERMTLSGRVIDASGKPIPLAKVTAAPIPVHLDFSEDPIETGATAYSVTCNQSGQFRLERVIVSGGVKEGMWMQNYDLNISAIGYRPASIQFQRCANQKDNFQIPNIVLEKPSTP